MGDQPVALVTGSRKGIGRALAEYFVARGMLVEGCSREPSEWQHDAYTHHLVDVADEAQVKGMFETIRKRHGRLDIAVSNAGIASMNHALLTPVASVDKIMETNFRGSFLVCRESAKLMMKRGYGRIVNIGSVAGPMNLEGEAIYASSKSAVITLTKILAYEFAPFGITCNVVSPTPTETDLIRSVSKEKIDNIVSRLAIKRLARFDDIVNAIDFFIRPESGYVTGQELRLGGA